LKAIVLVTGASSGIGEAICRLLVSEQYQVVAAARNLDKLQQIQQELGDLCHAVELDVNDSDSVLSLLERLPQNLREIDILVNNAGHDIGGRRSFELGSVERWTDIIETNVQGLMRVTHRVIGGMLERSRGHIVNMGSIAGLKPYATGSAYVTSKYAVHGFSDTLRMDTAGRGLRVTEIMPGLVRSQFAEQRLGDANSANEFYDNAESCLNPADVAQTVLFAINQPKHVEIAQLVVLPVS